MKSTKTNSDKLVSTKELADAAGESYDTIDHWSGQELLIFRKKGRNRLYPLDRNLARCKLIRELQSEDYPLAIIRKELSQRGE